MNASQLMLAAAAIVIAIGAAHWSQALFDRAARSRHATLRLRLGQTMLTSFPGVMPLPTRAGLQASYGLVAMLLGAVYAWLALNQPASLFASPFLACLGGLTLLAGLELYERHAYHTSFRAVSVAAVLYFGAYVVALTAFE